MALADELRDALEHEERETVGNSFGGKGNTSDFTYGRCYNVLRQGVIHYPADSFTIRYRQLEPHFTVGALKKVLKGAIRFAFLIELTNVMVTSTKTKTRWLPVETVPRFAVGVDPRASTFEECYEIFIGTLTRAVNDAAFRTRISVLAERGGEWTYPLTYVYPDARRLHVAANIRAANAVDLDWILAAEAALSPCIGEKAVKKIRVKAYRTDRAQTGVSQTNRAKRWEASPMDYQYATVEDCWAVERRLLERLTKFLNFPAAVRLQLEAGGLIPPQAAPTAAALCPVTLLPLDFVDFITHGAHGRSDFHVGHLHPLKSGGRHVANNVDWLSHDGNRIQGDRSIQETHGLLRGIVNRLA